MEQELINFTQYAMLPHNIEIVTADYYDVTSPCDYASHHLLLY